MANEKADTTNNLRKTNKTSDVHFFVPDSKFEVSVYFVQKCRKLRFLGYLITGDKRLWDMFSTQYEATKLHLKKNKYMMSVHAGAPKNRVKEHQDALQAFWPGLQVLAGMLWGKCWEILVSS